VAVVGTAFSLRLGSTSAVLDMERGAVEVHPASGTAPIRVEAGFTATLAATGVTPPLPRAVLPQGTPRSLALTAADYRAANGVGWEGTVDGGELLTHLIPPDGHGSVPVTRLQIPLPGHETVRVTPDLRVVVELAVDKPTVVSLLLVVNRADGSNWLGNIQGQLHCPAGPGTMTFHLDDLGIATGSTDASKPGGIIRTVVLMSWTPAEILRIRRVEIQSGEGGP
jgi:hypothetical protein